MQPPGPPGGRPLPPAYGYQQQQQPQAPGVRPGLQPGVCRKGGQLGRTDWGLGAGGSAAPPPPAATRHRSLNFTCPSILLLMMQACRGLAQYLPAVIPMALRRRTLPVHQERHTEGHRRCQARCSR